mmetsp:Transcript_88324/g.175590  ORF Transcript_88324/g.175590 Transcript_88324/m.175590 type:complete len:851 (+) Transcript_88324:80-2632(+)
MVAAILQAEPQAPLICDINAEGRLLEFGADPLARQVPEVRRVSAQTSDVASQQNQQATFCTADSKAPSAATATSAASKTLGQQPTVSQVLELAVGLLGLEVHKAPKPWAEAWLAFGDTMPAASGFGGVAHACHNATVVVANATTANHGTWQDRVLQQLRCHIDGGGGHSHGKGKSQRCGTGGSSEEIAIYQEHVELAEHVLKRITHAVAVLDGAHKQDSPITLRQYTEEMVMEVCSDMKQWLERLAELISLYHVHILDVDAERDRLREDLASRKAKVKTTEQACKDAVRRQAFAQQRWEEEKMRQRAAAMLGISLEKAEQDEEKKIYSQSEMEELQDKWEREHMAPMLQQLRTAQKRLGELEAQLRRPSARFSHDSKECQTSSEHVSRSEQQSQYTACLAALLDGVAERTVNKDLSTLVAKLAHSVQHEGSDLSGLSRELEQLPIPSHEPAPSSGDRDVASLKSVTSCLSVVELELKAVAQDLQGGADGGSGLQSFATWAQHAVASALSALKGSGTAQWGAAPQCNMSSLRTMAMPSKRTASVNTGPELVKHLLEGEVEARLRSMQELFAAKLNEVQAQADQWKKSWEEVSQQLAEETARAEGLVSELRQKLLDMMRRLKQAGVGKQVEEALEGSDLACLIAHDGDNVFERLYRDAQQRMRRLAEDHARIFNLTSESLQQILGSLTHPGSLVTSAPGTQVTTSAQGGTPVWARPCSVDTLLAAQRLHLPRTSQQRENNIASVASFSGDSALLPRLELRGQARSPAGHAGVARTEAPAERAAPPTNGVAFWQCRPSSRPLSSPTVGGAAPLAAPQRCAHQRNGTLRAARSVPRLSGTVTPGRFTRSAGNAR